MDERCERMFWVWKGSQIKNDLHHRDDVSAAKIN